MPLLLTALLAASLAPHAPAAVAMHPGDTVVLVVTDADRAPLPGVSVRMRAAVAQSPANAPHASQSFVTTSDGSVQFSLPPEGRYTLHLAISGFLSTELGPFVVCPTTRSSCGPSLVTPVRVTLPMVVDVQGATVR